MTAPLVDPALARDAGQQDDLVARKRSIDALRQRVGAQPDKAKKLREACEGFESVFLQKMWEQMRTTVPKEGYLHSREEQFWQSMFDQELAKKMSSAGGIGLADMLYDQLSSTLLSASRRSASQGAHDPVPVPPVSALPQQAEAGTGTAGASGDHAAAAGSTPGVPAGGTGAGALYAPLTEQPGAAPAHVAEGGVAQGGAGQTAPAAPSAADAAHGEPPLGPEQQAVVQRELAAYARQVSAQRRMTEGAAAHAGPPAEGVPGSPGAATAPTANAAAISGVPGAASAQGMPPAGAAAPGHGPSASGVSATQGAPAQGAAAQGTTAQESAAAGTAQDAARAARSAGAGFMTPPPVVRSPRNSRADIPVVQNRNAGRRTDAPRQAPTGPRVPTGQPVTQRFAAQQSPAPTGSSIGMPGTHAGPTGVQQPSPPVGAGNAGALNAPSAPVAPAAPAAASPAAPGVNAPAQGPAAPVVPGPATVRPTAPVGGPAPAPLPGTLQWPAEGRIAEGFGWRNDPVTGERAWHPGVDLAASEGAPVRACWDGRVVFAGEQGDYGNLVVLEHAGGWRSYYGHNAGLSVRAGDVVASGSELAKVGSTGRANGPHVHFEVRLGELALNPETLAGKGNLPHGQ